MQQFWCLESGKKTYRFDSPHPFCGFATETCKRSENISKLQPHMKLAFLTTQVTFYTY